MRFDKAKYKLLHLTRTKTEPTEPVRLGEVVLTPESKVRVLRVWLDRRLNWNRHMEEIRKKMKRQILSLQRLVDST